MAISRSLHLLHVVHCIIYLNKPLSFQFHCKKNVMSILIHFVHLSIFIV